MSERASSVLGDAIRGITFSDGEAAIMVGSDPAPDCAALAAIADERAYQDGRWGAEHDDGHTVSDWLNIVEDQFWHAVDRGNTKQLRGRLIKVAAVCAAAIERIDAGTLRDGR